MKLQIDKKEIEKIVNMYISDKYPDVNLEWQDDMLVADITLLPTNDTVTKEEHQEPSPSNDNTVTGLFS